MYVVAARAAPFEAVIVAGRFKTQLVCWGNAAEGVTVNAAVLLAAFVTAWLVPPH